jgi:hypothetical protein
MAWTPCVRLYDIGSPRDTSAELVPVDEVGVVVTESAEDVSLPGSTCSSLGPLARAVCAVVVTFRSVRSWPGFGSR